MIHSFIKKQILRNFYQIELSNFEKQMADDAVTQKYVPSILSTLFYSFMLIPALLILNTNVVISVLIPTTMVAGTAWFSVSLANMKKKFEDFGMELTKHLFIAFTLSLAMLLLSTIASITSVLWNPYIPKVAKQPIPILLSSLLAILVVIKLLYSIFAGSLKYDINDAMLTGQNEAAERFFKQSLSLLYTTSLQLRSGMSLQVANYSLGIAFYEIFNNIKELQHNYFTIDMSDLLNNANKLIESPAMKQTEADLIVLRLIHSFIELCSNSEAVQAHRSYKAIKTELICLSKNMALDEVDINKEKQVMVDTIMSVVFSEMSNLIEEFGPSLFEGQK